MTVVDGGANVGYYTLLASSTVGDGGHVYAFEPDVRNLDYLRSNVAANLCSNVTVEGGALADLTGDAPFNRDPYGAEGFVGGTGAAAIVRVVRLDDYFRVRQWPRVDLVKLDIEGGEPKA